MPADVDPVAALLEPEALRLPGQIVAGFAPGQDPQGPANALTTLALNAWVARRRLGATPGSTALAALDSLDLAILSAMEAFRRLVDAP